MAMDVRGITSTRLGQIEIYSLQPASKRHDIFQPAGVKKATARQQGASRRPLDFNFLGHQGAMFLSDAALNELQWWAGQQGTGASPAHLRTAIAWRGLVRRAIHF